MTKQVPSGYKQTKVGIIPEDWELVKLEDIATFLKGNGISKEEVTKDGVACIRYGELYTKYKEKINQIYCRTLNKDGLVYGIKNDVIIPSSGETAIDIATASCLQLDGVALGGDINIIRTKHNGIFLSYYLNVVAKTKIAALAQGASVIHLYSTHLRKLHITLPSRKEQEKIADILSIWDDAIAKQQQLIEQKKVFKKSMMQQIFTQKIRFKDDNGNDYPAWEEKKFGDGLYFIKTNSLSRSQLNLNNGAIKNIHYGDIHTKFNDYIDFSYAEVPYINREVNLTIMQEQEYCKDGDIVIADVSEDYKDVGKAVEVKNIGSTKAVSGLHTILARNKIEFAEGFKTYMMQTKKIRLQIEKIANGISVIGISKSNLICVMFDYPCLEEQTKIADFLASIDDEIIKQTKILEQLKQQKKSLMQKLLTGQIRVA